MFTEASPVATPFAVPARESAATEPSVVAERARQEVAALYTGRAGEFLNYALALGRNEELARDALQEAFLRYFIALCGGERIDSPRAWIYRVMHNYLVDRIKEARHRQERSLQHVPPYRQDLEGECFRREVLHLIRGVLSAREYDCIRLRTAGLRYDEIATTLQLTSGTVGTLISRAVRKIRTALGWMEEAHK